VVLSNGTLLSNKSGSIEERTQTTTFTADWSLPISLSSAAGQCAGSGCALIRQLADCKFEQTDDDDDDGKRVKTMISNYKI